MQIFKAMAVAFSLYSKIPMPIFEWKEENMKNSICFFPLVGLVIGAIEYAFYLLCSQVSIPKIAIVAIALVIPILVTGGFHIDGFMDVMDGIKSYGSKEKRLEILKDPHIGAFSVISLVEAGLIYLAAVTVILFSGHKKAVLAFCMSFVISRILSGITSLKFPLAKKDGMLKDEVKFSNATQVDILLIELALVFIGAVILKPVLAGELAVAAGLTPLYYKNFAVKNFGGVTGDTAGYYLVINEIVMALVIAIGTYF